MYKITTSMALCCTCCDLIVSKHLSNEAVSFIAKAKTASPVTWFHLYCAVPVGFFRQLPSTRKSTFGNQATRPANPAGTT